MSKTDQRTTLDPKSVPSVPSVQRFLTAKDALDRFKAAHPTLLEELRELMGEYNAAAEAADKELRPQKASSGPFELLTVDVKYDAERLFNELGPEEFKNVGGTVHEVVAYQVDRTTIEALVQMQKIPSEVVAVVRKEIPKYRQVQRCYLP